MEKRIKYTKVERFIAAVLIVAMMMPISLHSLMQKGRIIRMTAPTVVLRRILIRRKGVTPKREH